VAAAAVALAALVTAGSAAAAARRTPNQPQDAATKSSTPAEVYPVPPDGVFQLHGRGDGHGHGLSQWGAYGAAKVDGLSTNQILHFYYPHTTLATKSTNHDIRVLLSAADAPARGYLKVKPANGLTVTPVGGSAEVLATSTAHGHSISSWRLQLEGSVVDLRDHAHGKWHTSETVGSGATFSDSSGKIPVAEPDEVMKYRGTMTGEIESGVLEAVDTVNEELYLRSVVPAEMPSSWSAAALRAQAVASPTTATRGRNQPKASWFDVYGDPRDQSYGGVGREASRTTKAIEDTAGEVVVNSKGHAIFAQYDAANGGWTVAGGKRYLPAQHDPYDGLIPNDAHAWVVPVSATSIEAAYPQVGTLSKIKITGRDGNGAWGGRVTSLVLKGSGTAVTLTGSDLQFALGLRSSWFRPEPLPAAPRHVKATANGKKITVTWKHPDSVKGASKVTGYRVSVSPGGYHRSVGAYVHTASIGKLPPDTYTVKVHAKSSAGNGPSASVVVKTGH
jgi:SpoIID/LytB domain protein